MHHDLTPDDLNALKEAAKVHALHLRREAIGDWQTSLSKKLWQAAAWVTQTARHRSGAALKVIKAIRLRPKLFAR